MTDREQAITTLTEHLDHWKRLLSEGICTKDEGERTINALNFAIKTAEQEPCRETDDYENEIEGLQNRLDIAEYDKERLREEVTNLEGKIKALEQEPCEDCITLRLKKGTLKYSDKDYVVYKKEWLKKWWQPELALLGIELPSIQPKTDVLGKIRAEIIERAKCTMNDTRAEGLYIALDIVNKYKLESEDKE